MGLYELLRFFGHQRQRQLNRIELKLDNIGELMATVQETLAAIDAKTDEIAADVAAEAADVVAVKALIESLKAGQTDPALAAQAQAALDKLTSVEANLKAVETDLNATGKTV